MMLLVARASMTGMLVFDYADRYPEALAELGGWYRAGRAGLARADRARQRARLPRLRC